MAPLPATRPNPGAASAALMVNPHVAALPPYNAGMIASLKNRVAE
jgi:histidinol-phosphate aminotransferase